ncbi:MAG: SDR family oxidoreductase [Anaerolineales bacterium]|nr:SDR family oxidoreductase [Anaerolineales bacterium]
MEIAGRVALVTGGGTGIGAAMAADLCQAGARVMIAGRRADRLAETVQAIRASGGEIAYRPTDVAVPEECARLVEATVAAYGPVDILVNNAGVVCHGRTIEEHTVADWDQVMAINLRAAFLLSVAVLPAMRERRQGFILMVSSDSGINHFRNQAIYGLSKHGLVELAQFILAEYAQYNVRALALCPGLTDTEMGLGFHPTVPENVLSAKAVAAWARWAISQPDSMKIAQPLVLSVMRDPFASAS